MGEIQILDYSNSKLVAMHAGLAKIQSGTFKIIHTIDLQSYENIVSELEKTMQTTTTAHPLIPYLSLTISQIKSHISRLKPKSRSRRSLDILGSAWKWLAGSPDHHDFEIIQRKMNDVLENNSNQVVINRLSIEKINNLTNVTNEIIKILKDSDRTQDDRISKLKYKLEIIKDEVANIEFAIHLAKVNVVNSFILSSLELQILDEVFDKNNIPFSSIDELLHFSKIKIASEGQNIIYIISIPTTDTDNCKRILIKPIKRGNIVNKIDFNYVLNCNHKIFGLRDNCESYNSITICNRDKIVDISETECIPKLLASRTSKCTTTNNEHVPTVEEIEEGILLLNQFIGEIETDNSTIWLNGSYVIHHYNSTIKIGNKSYRTMSISGTKPLPALVQPMKTDTEERTLSLELINEMNANNTQLIDGLESTNFISLSINIGMIAIFLIYALTILLNYLKKWNEAKDEDKSKIEKQTTTTIDKQPLEDPIEAQKQINPKTTHSISEDCPDSQQMGKSKSIHSLPFFS